MVRRPHHVPLLNYKANKWDMVSGSASGGGVESIKRVTGDLRNVLVEGEPLIFEFAQIEKLTTKDCYPKSFRGCRGFRRSNSSIK